MNNLSNQEIKIPIKNSDGETIKEDWKKGEKQSDGSTWHIPISVDKAGHEHFFVYDSAKRWAECECGRGGYVFPHNAKIENGHIFTIDGKLIA